MAPLSDFLTTAISSLPKPKQSTTKPTPNRKPITTKEKMDAAKAKNATTAAAESKANAAAHPEPSEDPTNAPPPKKKRKTKCLPPPSELSPPRDPASKKSKAAFNRRKKAVTTQEIMRQYEIGRTVMQGVQRERKAAERKRREEAARKRREEVVRRGEEVLRREEEEARRKGEEEEVKKSEEGRGGMGEERSGEGKGKADEAAAKGKNKKKEAKKAVAAATKKAKKAPPPKPPSAYALLQNHCVPSAVRYQDDKLSGVLFRPTVRAREAKAAMDAVKARAVAAGSSAPPPVDLPFAKAKEKKKEDGEAKEQKYFRVMDMPVEIRRRIWELAVLHRPFAVWPGQRRFWEQPDVCMAGMEVRGEVLGVFYEGNVWGVDVTPLTVVETAGQVAPAEGASVSGNDAAGSGADGAANAGASSVSAAAKAPKPAKATASAVKTPDPIAGIQPWAKALEAGAHLSKIQHWLFSSTPEVVVPPSRIPRVDDANSLVVYLRVWREAAVPNTEMETSGEVAAKAEEMLWRASVEIHREATCVIPGQAKYRRCVVRMTPAWVNDMVALLLRRAERQGGVTAETVLGVAKLLRSRVGELVGHRCEGGS